MECKIDNEKKYPVISYSLCEVGAYNGKFLKTFKLLLKIILQTLYFAYFVSKSAASLKNFTKMKWN